MPNKFALPPAVANLVTARNALREHYSAVQLRFTLDGNLVGDIGEAIAAELFGIRLVDAPAAAGIDGFSPDGRTVQVKATGTARGPAFRPTEQRADYLLFFDLDFENARGAVLYNGPEAYVFNLLPKGFVGQRLVSRARVIALNEQIQADERLPRIT